MPSASHINQTTTITSYSNISGGFLTSGCVSHVCAPGGREGGIEILKSVSVLTTRLPGAWLSYCPLAPPKLLPLSSGGIVVTTAARKSISADCGSSNPSFMGNF